MISRIALNQFLLKLLSDVTAPEVLELESELKASEDPQEIFAQFEVQPNTKQRDPNLEEQWAHYSWLKLEVSFIANQHVTQLEIKNHAQSLDNIDRLIKEEFTSGKTIEESLEVLKKICLQAVTTEHPTCPLSKEARDLLSEVAAHISKAEKSVQQLDTKEIKELFSRLLIVDTIPRDRRDVEEEVNRDIRIGTNPLYDTLPVLITSITSAYRIYYAKVYDRYENQIWEILQKLVRDCTWAGFDADNNDNVTPLAMRNAIRIRHVRAAEQHSIALDTQVIRLAKDIERKLRSEIFELFETVETHLDKISLKNLDKVSEEATQAQIAHSNQTDQMLSDLRVGDNGNLRNSRSDYQVVSSSGWNAVVYAKNFQRWRADYFNPLQRAAKKALGRRNFAEVVKLFESYGDISRVNHGKHFAPSPELIKPMTQESFLMSFRQQLTLARALLKLTAFSGSYYSEGYQNGRLKSGALQDLLVVIDKYKTAIREQTGLIEIEKMNPTYYILGRYNKLMHEHAVILDEYPQLKSAMRMFGVLLHSYGMSYGRSHIRQDSSVFTAVWQTILNDLKTRPEFANNRLVQNYTPIAEWFFQSILVDTEETRQVFEAIYHSLEHYKDNAEFSLVTRELQRLELALVHHDMVENIIISNAETSEHIFSVLALLKVFPMYSSSHLNIVPLLEKREDLENYKKILEQFIKWRIMQALPTEAHLFEDANLEEFIALTAEYKDRLNDVVIEVMLGFSDTERVSGLSALLSIQKAQEDLIRLCKQYNVTYKLFHGPGADLLRGGSHLRKQKSTVQDTARTIYFGTQMAAVQYRETQFVNAFRAVRQPVEEIYGLSQRVQNDLQDFCKKGAAFFEDFHDTKKGYGNLTSLMFGYGANWIVTRLNSSSRASERNNNKKVDRWVEIQTGDAHPDNFVLPDKLRAITYSQINEMLRTFFHVIIGPGHALRSMDKKRIRDLYLLSPTFRDLYEKLAYGLSLADLDIAAQAYFYGRPDLRYTSNEQRKQMADWCIAERGKPSTAEIKEHLKTPNGRDLMLKKLSRFFAYIEQEYHLTKEFMFDVNKNYLHKAAYQSFADITQAEPTPLLHHMPEWRANVVETCEQSKYISILMSRLNLHVAKREKLDQVYGVTIDTKFSGSQLSFIARLVGSVGSAITAFRYMVFPTHLHAEPRYGVERAERLSVQLVGFYARKRDEFNALNPPAEHKNDGVVSPEDRIVGNEAPPAPAMRM